MVGLLSTHHARPTHEISDDASQPRRAALGAAERVARDCDPLREDRLQLHGRPLPRRHPRLAQALTGPRHLLITAAVCTDFFSPEWWIPYAPPLLIIPNSASQSAQHHVRGWRRGASTRSRGEKQRWLGSRYAICWRLRGGTARPFCAAAC